MTFRALADCNQIDVLRVTSGRRQMDLVQRCATAHGYLRLLVDTFGHRHGDVILCGSHVYRCAHSDNYTLQGVNSEGSCGIFVHLEERFARNETHVSRLCAELHFQV